MLNRLARIRVHSEFSITFSRTRARGSLMSFFAVVFHNALCYEPKDSRRRLGIFMRERL